MLKGKYKILFFLAIVNFVAFVYMYFLHQNKLGIQGLECIKELGISILFVPFLLIIALIFKFKIRPMLISFFSILSLVSMVYLMAAHSGDRSAVSLFQHPAYLIAVITSAAIISLNFYDETK